VAILLNLLLNIKLFAVHCTLPSCSILLSWCYTMHQTFSNTPPEVLELSITHGDVTESGFSSRSNCAN